MDTPTPLGDAKSDELGVSWRDTETLQVIFDSTQDEVIITADAYGPFQGVTPADVTTASNHLEASCTVNRRDRLPTHQTLPRKLWRGRALLHLPIGSLEDQKHWSVLIGRSDAAE